MHFCVVGFVYFVYFVVVSMMEGEVGMMVVADAVGTDSTCTAWGVVVGEG